MAKVIPPVKQASLLIGQCVPCFKQNAAKIHVVRLHLDNYLKMFFPHDEFYYATDPERKIKTGNIVLIRPLAEKLSKLITHEVVQTVHHFGDAVDPVTGRKIIATKYRDDVDEETDLYGRLSSAFDYKNAPPRGWLEGKRDFTDKETYRKFHVFEGKEDPYSVY